MIGASLVAGFLLLLAGAELLVRGAASLALRFRIAPLIVGLTVVAYGTSAPELAVSIGSALTGQADLAVGNVVGSNVFNVLFVLGLSAAITPLVVQQRLVRLDVPLMIGLSLLVAWMGRDGSLGRGDGLLLATGAVLYTGFLFLQGRRGAEEAPPVEVPAAAATHSTGRLALYIVVGLGLLVGGSRLLVIGAVAMARTMGVSELMIGLTIVAAGTSLPEVATSILAALRGERDLAVGNVVGSNIFNLLAVLGFTASISPDGVPVAAAALRFDIPVMIGVAVACLPVFFTGHLIARWEGGLFLAYYVAYVTYLILAGSRSPVTAPFASAMIWFVLPLTVVTLVLLGVRTLYRGPRQGS